MNTKIPQPPTGAPSWFIPPQSIDEIEDRIPHIQTQIKTSVRRTQDPMYTRTMTIHQFREWQKSELSLRDEKHEELKWLGRWRRYLNAKNTAEQTSNSAKKRAEKEARRARLQQMIEGQTPESIIHTLMVALKDTHKRGGIEWNEQSSNAMNMADQYLLDRAAEEARRGE